MTTTPDHDANGSQPHSAPEPAAGQPQPHVPQSPLHQTPGQQPPVAAPAPQAPAESFTQSQPTVPLGDALPQGPAHSAPAEPVGGSAGSAPAGSPFAPTDPAHGQVPAPAYAGVQAPSGAAFQQSSDAHAFAQPGVDPEPQMHSAQPKNRTGALLAGLAIGALLGGIVGGGVAAVVSSNTSAPVVAAGGGTLTLNNPDSATTISGVAAVATPSVVTLEVAGANASGSGSGVIYREDGYIITNAHVVTLDGAAGTDATIRVKLSDGRILDGDLVGVDPYADLAVVKVDADSLPAITVADSSELNVGDVTVAIGAPLNLANTVTSGVVSAMNRGISVGSPLIPQDPSAEEEQQPDDGGGEGSLPWDFRFGTPDDGSQGGQQQQSASGTVTLPVIQTDASINPGNSGGALLDADGALIGINVAIASTSSTSETAGSVGLGFAIPSNLAQRVADALIAGEQPSHGLLGASVVDSSQDTDDDRNVAGGLVVDVTADGAAEQAGLRSGDVITAVDGIPAVDGTSVSALIRVHEGGSTVSIDYSRGGKTGQTEATLGNLEW